nr:hypothetical protein [Tanacetum cinerariifolium]
MARLAFCDYHNMIAILEKYEHNIDFHQIVDFVEASHLRYALTINPTVYVSHIRQFWSTARIETTDEGTKILATVDGISSLSDAELFENLTLMGYNILPNQKFSFQKGTPTKPQHTPSPEAQQTSPTATSSPSLPPVTIATIPTQDEMALKITAHDLEISALKAMIKHLEDRDGGDDDPSGEDATIKGMSLETGEEAGIERGTEKGIDDTEEMVNVLTFLDAVSVLSSGVQVSVSPVTEVATMARQLKEEMERDAQRINEQITRDAKITRIYAEKELQMLIDGLDRNNLPIGERIELINDLVKYQDNYAKVIKYQTQQRKPLSKKQQKEFYISVLRSHDAWKTKHFKGMSLEEIREKFVLMWKQIKDFIPIGSKEERERFKKKGLRLEHDSAKKMKTLEEVSEEELKMFMQLVPVEEVYVEALQALVKETLSIRPATSDKEKELWVKLKRLYEPDVEHQTPCPIKGVLSSQKEMDHQYPTVAKIPVLDTGKFKQWQFRIQQYLQHEHYALWEVIKSGDSYKVPTNTNPDDTTTKRDADQSGKTLRFSKYKTAKELWAAILKTFGGNEATKKRKKNLLKQQYGNFKAEGTQTLEQTFNRLQVIVSQLQFMDVKVEKDDLNQKFLTSLAPDG